MLRQTFDRVTRPAGYTVDDLRAITAPTLILLGDRYPFCSVEQGVTAYRGLTNGEIAVLPHIPNGINAQGVQTMIDFLDRSAQA